MDKIWYIVFGDIEEGPFSVEDLLNDVRVTEDTLAWREGFDSWIPIKDIPELKELFVKQPPDEMEEEEEAAVSPQDEIVLDFQKDPTFFFLWLLITVILISFVLYILFGS